MKMRYLFVVVMFSLTGLSQGLKLKNGKFSESLNATVRCGVISQIEISNVPVSILDLDTLLEAGKFNTDEPYQQALTSRAPGQGKIFVILTFEVKEGFSVGRYDYVLVVGKNEAPIQAISVPGKPFDPRVWELKAESGMKIVAALFEIPLPTEPVTGYLQPQLNTTLTDAAVKLPIGREINTHPPAEPVSKAPEVDAVPEAPEKKTESAPEPEKKFVTEKASEKKPKTAPKKTTEKKPAKSPGKKSTTTELDDLFR